MSGHLIIYLDESGELGFDFNKQGTNQYFVIGLLVCEDREANQTVIQSVKKTLKNKLPKNCMELKGSNLILSIKKYFLTNMRRAENWRIYIAIADKKTWIAHHNGKNTSTLKAKTLYDALACRIFEQVDCLETANIVDLIVDRSKDKNDIKEFNSAITTAIRQKLSKDARLTIRHSYSHEEMGLQAIDLFCAGAWRNKTKSDISWYVEFSDKVASEVTYNF